jgi:hypothetical protein
MEQGNIFNLLPAGQTSSAYFNGSGNPVPVKNMICPSDRSAGEGLGAGWNLASYLENGQVFLMGQYPSLAKHFSDGHAETILFCEQLALCPDPAGGNTATKGRNVWPAINLTTGDPILFWPNMDTTTNYSSIGFPGFATQYPTSKIADPVNGNVKSFLTPKANPTLGAGGNCNPLTANSLHGSVVQMGMADGSVKGVSPNVSMKTWNAALTPMAGDILGPDW